MLLDPDWQHDCLVAMEKRARGEFDEWKEREMEAFWGQKQKLSYDVIAGESSKVKLETLIEAGCWEVGDVWVYTRCFGKGKNTIKIEKEATVSFGYFNASLFARGKSRDRLPDSDPRNSQ